MARASFPEVSQQPLMTPQHCIETEGEIFAISEQMMRSVHVYEIE